MKNNFKYYLVYWAILFALFNVIAFVSVGWIGFEKYTSSFWIGYSFITLTFFGQLFVSYIAFRPSNLQKVFYNISLITLSYTGLILSLIIGGLFMAISALPYYIGIIGSAIILAINAIAVLKAKAAAEIVSEIDDKIKKQTFFIKSLAVEAESVVNRVQNDNNKKIAIKVFEAIKYSDAMSKEELNDIEGKIKLKFEEYTEAIFKGDEEKINIISDELLNLISDRNKKCKLLK